MRSWIIVVLVLMAGLAHGAASDWQIVQVNTSTAAINLPLNLYGVPMLASNNTFSGGTTQAFDGVTVTNLTMRGGNIALGSGWLSGDGDSEGVSVGTGGDVAIGALAASANDMLVVNCNLTNDTLLANSLRGLTVGREGDCVIQQVSIGSSGAPTYGGRKYRGTSGAPTSVAWADFAMYLFGSFYDGTALRTPVAIAFRAVGVVSSNNVPADIIFQTGTNTANNCMILKSDRSMQMYNMTTAPNTGSGYGVIAVTNGEWYVWDSSGNKTGPLSPHNEDNEWETGSYNPYSGVSEKIHFANLAAAVEELLHKDHALKGKIYKRIQSEPTEDWRANEARQAAERSAEIAAWDQADSEHKAKLAAWDETTPELRKSIWGEKPVKEQDTKRPDPYIVRPIPTWAVGAQRKFDAKWGAEK